MYDPDGGGKDFAYTIGLHSRGLPELHIWARPSLGEDPGHDWMLSPTDRCHVLNELAELMLHGRIGIGSQLSREYDDRLATVTYRVDPPQDKEDLEAYAVPAGVDVLPVRWSLRRPPEGPPTALSPQARTTAQGDFATVTAGLDPRAPAPPGWVLPALPAFDIDQRFGPLTPVVLARAAQLWQADDDALCDLLHTAMTVAYAGSLTWPVARSMATARLVGRRPALDALHHATHDLVEWLTERPPAQRRWRSIVKMSDPQLWSTSSGSERHRIERNLAGFLHAVTHACLASEAVADVAEATLLLEGRGPWLSGLQATGQLPGPQWHASPIVLDAIHRLLVPLSRPELTTLATQHALGRDDSLPSLSSLPGYADVCVRLASWATVSAAGCPQAPVLTTLPAWPPDRGVHPGGWFDPVDELQHWATCVASALTHRARLSADDVDTLAAPHRVHLPELQQVPDDPL